MYFCLEWWLTSIQKFRQACFSLKPLSHWMVVQGKIVAWLASNVKGILHIPAKQSYLWQYCQPGSQVALVWTMQINSYTASQPWLKLLSSALQLAVSLVPFMSSTGVKRSWQKQASHGTFLSNCTPLTENITLFPNSLSLFIIFETYHCWMNTKLIFQQDFKAPLLSSLVAGAIHLTK